LDEFFMKRVLTLRSRPAATELLEQIHYRLALVLQEQANCRPHSRRGNQQ